MPAKLVNTVTPVEPESVQPSYLSGLVYVGKLTGVAKAEFQAHSEKSWLTCFHVHWDL